MISVLWRIAQWFVAGGIAQALTGAGITIVSAAWVGSYVDDLMAEVASGLSNIGGLALTFMAMGGIGQALTVIGSAIVARVTWKAAAQLIGLKLAGGN